MKQIVILRGERQREHVLSAIRSIVIDDDHLIEVVIRPHESSRSARQNNLYWKWATVAGNELGYSKDDMSEAFKRLFLAPDCREVMGQVVETYPSTAKLKVREMSAYMEQIANWCGSHGIALPHPEDIQDIRAHHHAEQTEEGK